MKCIRDVEQSLNRRAGLSYAVRTARVKASRCVFKVCPHTASKHELKLRSGGFCDQEQNKLLLVGFSEPVTKRCLCLVL